MNIWPVSAKRLSTRAAALWTALLLVASLAAGAAAQDQSGQQPTARPAPAALDSSRESSAQARSADSADAADPAALVDVLGLDPTFVLDIRYATPRNFTGRVLYPVARCLLRANTADRLVRVHERLRKEGLRLRLFDCYRPLSTQRELWALVPDERYVADPAKGSRHNRAAAVDLTLANASGVELPMPTEYDDFTPRAHRDYAGAARDQLANRARLEEAMAAEGFVGLPTEWWHFDAPGWDRYPILDVPLDVAEPMTPPHAQR